MNWQLLGPLLVTTAIAICGWFIVHRLNSRRDRANKQREQRISFLIDAYRRLESCAHRENSDARSIESAVADIQLFGSPRQVELVQAFVAEFAAQRSASMDEVLRELRRDLRTELEIATVPDKILHLRIRS